MGVAFDDLHGPITEQVRHVAVPFHRHLFLIQRVCERTIECGIATVIEIVGTAAEYAKEMIETALEGAEIRQGAEVPFADQCRAISYLLEKGRQRRVTGRQANGLGRRRTDWLFQSRAQSILVTAGNQR